MSQLNIPPEDRPWRWRNCREVTIGVQLRLFPWQWVITAEWLAETFTASGLLQFGPLVLTFWADIGNNSTGDWRARFGLAELTAWERAE